jgi:adenylate cyclase
MKSKMVTKLIAGIILGLVGAVVVWLLSDVLFPDLFYSYEARTYDNRVTTRIQDVPGQSIEDIVIVDIDGRSVAELGRFQQWSHFYYPRIIDYLNKGGVASIGLDIIFDQDFREPEADRAFVQAVQKAKNVYNAIYFEQADSLNWRYKMTEEPKDFSWQKFTYTLPAKISTQFRQEDRIGSEFYELLNASHAIGHVNFHGDVDGVVRKIHLFNHFNNHSYPSLALQMYFDLMAIDSFIVKLGESVDLYSDQKLVQKIPINKLGRMTIPYAGGFKTFRYISFYDVLEQRIPSEYFKNKLVFVGTSLPGLFDLRSVPFLPAFPGVEIHANILHTLRTGNFVKELTSTQNFVLLASIGIVIGIITIFFSPLWSIVVVLIIAVIHTFAAYYFYLESDFWIPIINPVLTLIFTFSSVYLYRYITEERGKRFIKETFSHFVTQSVVDELLENPDKIKLGGEKKECTVFFSDVSGFTTIAEQLTPEALVRLLNEYLTEMTNIIFKYDGMLDKYEGDAIMAVFGAPIELENHALKGCAAALEMQEQLIKLRNLWANQGRPQLRARCGLNTGMMIVGNMGSENRFDYTVMGDAVNLGARLEPANKQYGTKILIGENTYEKAKEHVIVRELDLLRVKGKTEPAKVYELLGLAEKGIPEKSKQVLDLFNKGFEDYLARNWESAIKYFNLILNIEPHDGPSITYVKRCEQFTKNPPGENWDGVFTLFTK